MANNEQVAAEATAEKLICPESRVKKFLEGKSRISAEALATLDQKIKNILDLAVQRSQANKRMTIKSCDL